MSNMSSLSSGALIYSVLSAGLGDMVTKVYPVVSEESSTLPYVVYRRANLIQQAVKSSEGAKKSTVEVVCYAATYKESLEIAEKVRELLDNTSQSYTSGSDTLVARRIILEDASESWAGDAYEQDLQFSVSIN